MFNIAAKQIDDIEPKDKPIDLLDSYSGVKDSLEGFKIYSEMLEIKLKLEGFFKQEFLEDIETFKTSYKELEDYFE
ncbi:hypothetical protein ACJROX_12795 [Pseudalkalibacillus sp. A8]|uniref:hypothetical protein n=1 Tax=Pseudalkalibacillus sp. A8 TaxID=3382641 RepID=UPI0038B5E1EE